MIRRLTVVWTVVVPLSICVAATEELSKPARATGALASKVEFQLERATSGEALTAVAEAAGLQLVAEEPPGRAVDIAVSGMSAAEALDRICSAYGLEWGVAGEAPVVVVRAADAEFAASAPEYWAAYDLLAATDKLTWELAADLLEMRLAGSEQACLGSVFPASAAVFRLRTGTAALCCLAQERREVLLTDGEVSLTDEEGLALREQVPGLLSRPTSLRVRPTGDTDASPLRLTLKLEDGSALEVGAAALPAGLSPRGRVFEASREVVEMEGRHEGRNDRVVSLNADAGDLRRLLHQISGPEGYPPDWSGTAEDMRRMKQWYALCVHRSLGAPRVTCRIRDVATRQDLIPALLAAFRADDLVGVEFSVLVPDRAAIGRMAQRQAEAPGGEPSDLTFARASRRGARAQVAFAAVETLTWTKIHELLSGRRMPRWRGPCTEVAFAGLSPEGRAAVVRLATELRRGQQPDAAVGERSPKRTQYGPGVPEIDWERTGDILVRLRVAKKIGLQVGIEGPGTKENARVVF